MPYGVVVTIVLMFWLINFSHQTFIFSLNYLNVGASYCTNAVFCCFLKPVPPFLHSLLYSHCSWALPAIEIKWSEVKLIYYPPCARESEGRGICFYFYCMFFGYFCSFLSMISRQILHAGVLWFRMCILPFWGLAAPRDGKRGKWNFRYYRSQWGNLHFGGFWAISQQRVNGSTPNFMCVRTMSADVPLPPLGSIGPLGRVERELKTQKKLGWSHSCIGQLPFLFFSALPNVVQYVGHRPAHILI